MTGISGKYDHLIRPLLFASKEEILTYASEHNLQWREDRSNDTDDYKRNLIRHKVIPVFQQLNPSLEHTFNVTSERLRGANNLLNEFLEQWKAEQLLMARTKSGSTSSHYYQRMSKHTDSGTCWKSSAFPINNAGKSSKVFKEFLARSFYQHHISY
jgi:tRNA(Ile)-lysidine synthase TilS/MesJ